MISTLLFALLPAAVTAFTCAASVPAATCSSLASVFSSQWQNQTRIPTITITLKNPPTSAVAPRPFSPAQSPAVTNWTPAGRPTPATTPPPRLPAPKPAPRPVSSASYWSTCIDSSPLTCRNLLCTSLPGACTPWVEGDGPARDFCIDGEPARCEGSECAAGADADDDISPSVCNGWVDPSPTPAGNVPPRFTPPWAAPRPRVSSTLATGFLGGATLVPGTGFTTVTITRPGLGPWVGM